MSLGILNQLERARWPWPHFGLLDELQVRKAIFYPTSPHKAKVTSLLQTFSKVEVVGMNDYIHTMRLGDDTHEIEKYSPGDLSNTTQ